MMADVTCVIHSEWADPISHLSVDQQDAILADVFRYCTSLPLQHSEDPAVSMALGFLKTKIDFSKNKYLEKKTGGQINGARRKKYSTQEIYEMSQKYPDNAEKVAEELGCSKSTIDHSEGWRRRKEMGLVFED